MDPYVGEIRIFAGTYAPVNWALCNGQLLPIQHYSVLYSVIGAQYGGDGKTNFAMPDLRGHVPMHQGAGPGLTPRQLGQKIGQPSVTLLESQIPPHNHVPQAIDAIGTETDPKDHLWAQSPKEGRPGRQHQRPLYDSAIHAGMAPNALHPAGGSQPHNNMQPYLTFNFIICLEGIYPPRS